MDRIISIDGDREMGPHFMSIPEYDWQKGLGGRVADRLSDESIRVAAEVYITLPTLESRNMLRNVRGGRKGKDKG